jgi:hypothetical protein
VLWMGEVSCLLTQSWNLPTESCLELVEQAVDLLHRDQHTTDAAKRTQWRVGGREIGQREATGDSADCHSEYLSTSQHKNAQ